MTYRTTIAAITLLAASQSALAAEQDALDGTELKHKRKSPPKAVRIRPEPVVHLVHAGEREKARRLRQMQRKGEA